MKKSLPMALAMKPKAKGCPACTTGVKCMAHGGQVENDGAHDALLVEGNKDKYADSKAKRMLPDAMSPAKEREAHLNYAEGGQVNDMRPLHTKPDDANHELDASEETAEMAPHEMVDQDMRGEEDSSDDEEDLPRLAKSLSLAAEVMKDRKRLRMAEGGQVDDMKSMRLPKMSKDLTSDKGDDSYAYEPANGANETNDSDELDAEAEDGRQSRGMNIETAHVMSDKQHDQSDASNESEDGDDDSLVAQILKERKMRRR